MNLRAVKTNTWYGGFQAQLKIPIEKTTRSWELTMKFSGPVSTINLWDGETELNSDNTEVTATSFSWSGEKQAGTTYVLGFVVHFAEEVSK